MSLLIENQVDFKFYDKVPDLSVSYKEFSEKQAKAVLRNLGHLFAKHGLSDQYGLAMVHRHFDLNEKEILVEAFNADDTLSAATPWDVKENTAYPSDDSLRCSFGVEVKQYVVPQSWSFTEAGDLKAFEYLSTNNNELATPPLEFASELFHQLKVFGLEKIIGLRRIESRQGTFSWETTPDGVRANVTRFGDRPENLSTANMIPVVWYFDEFGNLVESDWCVLHSGSVCHHKDN